MTVVRLHPGALGWGLLVRTLWGPDQGTRSRPASDVRVDPAGFADRLEVGRTTVASSLGQSKGSDEGALGECLWVGDISWVPNMLSQSSWAEMLLDIQVTHADGPSRWPIQVFHAGGPCR